MFLQLDFVLERLLTDAALDVADVNSDLVSAQVGRRHKRLVALLAGELLFR